MGAARRRARSARAVATVITTRGSVNARRVTPAKPAPRRPACCDEHAGLLRARKHIRSDAGCALVSGTSSARGASWVLRAPANVKTRGWGMARRHVGLLLAALLVWTFKT